MSVKKNLMLWAAVFALVFPLMFVGTASAKYMVDGAAPNGTTGGWNAPTDGICVLSIDASGNMVTDATITNKRDCDARLIDVTAVTANAALSTVCTTTLANTAGIRYAAPGSNTCVTIDGSGYITGSISMVNLDRNATMCIAKGGQLANATAPGMSVATKTTANGTAAKCIAYGWQYRGQDATGAPLTFGAKGTTQGAGTGYCYTTMNMSTAYTTTAACPSYQATAAPFNANAAYDWSWSNPKCTYAKGIAGYVNAALTRVDGSTYAAANTFTDLSTLTTQGDCLAAGASWANWIGQAGSTTSISIPTTPNASTIPAWDYTRQAPDADNGCLHCHSYTSQQNGPSERFKDSFLKTGHKNMLRKVTAGQKMAGPDGVMYDTLGYAAGSIDFAAATATVGGVAKPLLYLFGDWMAAAPAGLDVVVNMSGLAKYNGSSNYSCAACHTEGWSNPGPGTCSNATSTLVGSTDQATCEAAGKVWTDAGLCSLSSKKSQSACTTAGGTWYPNIGVQGIGTSGYAGTQPADSFPGITFQGAGVWNNDGISCGRCHNAAVGPVNAAMIAASAFPATQPTGGGMGALAAGLFRNNLCFGCHQNMAATNNGTGTDVDLNNPTALIVKNTATAPAYVPGFSGHVLGNSFLNSPHARFTGAIKVNSLGKYDLVGSSTSTVITAAANYNSTFRGYGCYQSATSASPAKTKADATEIKSKAECDALWACTINGVIKPGYTQTLCTAVTPTPGVWASTWRADTGSTSDVNGIQGTCTTCHDVHNSLFVVGQEGLRKECDSCHNNTDFAAAVPGTFQATTINHPTSAGTPAGIEPDDPCVVCHMPKPTSGDFPMHVWRINSDVAYSTFPTSTEFGIGATATKKNANTATDSKGYTKAVWVDVDLACGQCHGGSAGTGATKNGAPYFTKAALAAGAAQMHNSGYVPPVGTTPVVSHGTVTQTGYLVSFTDSSTDSGDTSNLDAVTVNWGDGATSAGVRGGIFTHTYTGRARNVSIVHMVRNSTDQTLYAKEYLKLNVPIRFNVTGTVFQSDNATAITNVYVYLKQNNHARQVKKSTDGTFTFTNVMPGSYTIHVYKSGVTFGADVPVTVSSGNVLQNVQAITP